MRSVAELWQKYKETGSETAAEELAENYLPLVRQVVARLQIKLPPSLEREDLVGFGVLGLLQAIQNFDPARQVKFEAYATARIRGAILDELRANQWLSRTVVEKLKRLHRAESRLEQELGRAASPRELAGALGVPEEEVYELWQYASNQAALSLEDFLGDDGDGTTLKESLADDQARDPQNLLLEKDLTDRIRQSLARLQEKDRLVLNLYYYDELTLKEIGQVLGVSESRACQLHGRALARLKTFLIAAEKE